MNGQTDGWTDWTDGQTDGWTDGQMRQSRRPIENKLFLLGTSVVRSAAARAAPVARRLMCFTGPVGCGSGAPTAEPGSAGRRSTPFFGRRCFGNLLPVDVFLYGSSRACLHDLLCCDVAFVAWSLLFLVLGRRGSSPVQRPYRINGTHITHTHHHFRTRLCRARLSRHGVGNSHE